MNILTIEGLCKTYPAFRLDNISFSLEEGRIAGFIGRNGAGKTTTIKCMLNLVHPDSGNISYFGKNLMDSEREIKKRIGYSTGAISWYPRKKIKDIAAITKEFYDTWDEKSYRKYMDMFNINEEKTPKELSEGMKVKLNLMLALSHRAELLILDEPTSGLDPFSRDELLDVFMDLKKDGTSIFFSTHIITDLERCADDIIYISGGRIDSASSKEAFVKDYSLEGERLEDTILRLERRKRNDLND